MQTFVVEILDDKAVPLLRDLENLSVIRLTEQSVLPEITTNEPVRKRSDQLRGSISPEVAADLHRQLTALRNEW
ncbi:hypothetical protein [Spirosoma rhododendri]|uniref:Uncharacterized protein n=1 Tax=Spirosoma rhododendri TaxID=2728024 RepID=A0A7L5DP63_9BACT|nr:hypothetical protein [Spirosoma rhododendri]QJD80249.1 hypothetical protein HH216_18865 [Spirosoma rhododendri]